MTFSELKLLIDAMDEDTLARDVKYYDETTNSHLDVFGLTYFTDTEPSIVLTQPNFVS